MEDLKNTREMTLVAEAYTRYRTLLVAYANKRTRNLADAEDVVQEAFIKIINMGDMVYAATIRNLAFTTVQNLLIDRLRRRVVVSEVHSYIYDIQPEFTEETESAIHANSLLQAEYTFRHASRSVPESILHEPFRRTDGRRNIEGTSYQPPYGGGTDTERAEKGASLSQGCRRLLTGRQKNHLP